MNYELKEAIIEMLEEKTSVDLEDFLLELDCDEETIKEVLEEMEEDEEITTDGIFYYLTF